MTSMNDDGAAKTLKVEMDALRRETRGTKVRLALSFSAWTLALLLAILGVGWLTTEGSIGLVPLAFSLLCIFLGALVSLQPPDRAFAVLESVADVRAVGPLLDLLPLAFAGRKRVILALLIRLLPTLQPGDAGLLLPTHRRQLRQTLFTGDFRQESAYLIAILKALEQIGTREDLSAVEFLAVGESDSWQERQVRDAARACLPCLRERIEQRKDSDVLLRPACGGAPEQLLHPATGGSASDPAQLLRPDATVRLEDIHP
ncbi:MAG: hypothetical protein JWN14_3944 [Chthonomonadales bacterium]|nr:hypothetical protein [Chthonomonadales bacterium]